MYLKFCKDFDIPVRKHDQQEVYRKKSVRAGESINYEKFLDVLKELFFVKDNEDRILVK